MSFLWPQALLLLLAVPLLVAAYLALVRRRAERAAELAAQGFVPTRLGAAAPPAPARAVRLLPRRSSCCCCWPSPVPR